MPRTGGGSETEDGEEPGNDDENDDDEGEELECEGARRVGGRLFHK